ncbi:MAG TPA: alpha/beta hydrolase [Kofleriaceae bacterium]
MDTERVSFVVDGDEVVGVLFVPDGTPTAVLVVDGPLTSVKEQVGTNYGKAFAARGFAALALDHRHFGESGGQPRQYEHPGRKVEDIRAALGFLTTHRPGLPLGVVGVCAGAGYAAHAVAVDPRVRAFGSVAGFFHDVEQQRTWMKERFDPAIERARAAREHFEQTGEAESIPAVGTSGEVAMPLEEAFEYYGTPRGGVPGYTNNFAVMSREHTLPWDAQSAAPKITAPTILVHSDQALAPPLAKKFYTALGGPKELVWTESRGQVDFYDEPALVDRASDHLARFFREHLLG